jgi:hypothetical protein
MNTDNSNNSIDCSQNITDIELYGSEEYIKPFVKEFQSTYLNDINDTRIKRERHEDYLPDDTEGQWIPPVLDNIIPHVGSPEYKKYMYDSITNLLEDFLRHRKGLLPATDVAVRDILDHWHEFSILPTDFSKVTLTRGSNAIDHDISPSGLLLELDSKIDIDQDTNSTHSSMPDLISCDAEFDTDSEDEDARIYGTDKYLRKMGY